MLTYYLRNECINKPLKSNSLCVFVLMKTLVGFIEFTIVLDFDFKVFIRDKKFCMEFFNKKFSLI
jgi:hypothetical protein